MLIPSREGFEGVSYKKFEENGITGSLTMRAYDDFDNLVNLTAKGSEGK